MAGNCDSGYSCVYSSTMAWRSATTPLPKEVNPQAGVRAAVRRRQRRRPGSSATQVRKSILDFVREDAGSLRSQLGVSDRRKLDEYFAAVRDIEQRIARAEKLPPVEGARRTPARPASRPATRNTSGSCAT